MNHLDIPASTNVWRSLHKDHVSEMIKRHDELFRRFANLDAIVIHSGKTALKYSRDDQYWPTAMTPHFVHWTPYAETPALLVLRPAQRPCLFMERHTSFWEGPAPENECWDRDSFDCEELSALSDARTFGSCVYIGDDEASRPNNSWSVEETTAFIAALDGTRRQKTPYEVASIREATRIASLGHARLRDLFLSGEALSELDLHYEYLKTTRQTEFSQPYGDIVGLGAHAAILHHVHYDPNPRSGDLSMLLDAGATCNGYASDITRTYARGNGPGAKLFQRLIDGVNQVQQVLCKKFVVGSSYESLHNEAHVLLAEVLRDLKLTSAITDDLVSSGATRCLFPHGLGHSLGIQVHDVAMKQAPSADQNPYLRNTAMIASGQVVTVEPGIYFIETLLKKLKAMPIGNTFDWAMIELLTPFGGVRIEDNIFATEEGAVNLTRDLVP